MGDFLATLDPAGLKAVTAFWLICCVVLGTTNRKRPAIIFGVLGAIFVAAIIYQKYWLFPR